MYNFPSASPYPNNISTQMYNQDIMYSPNNICQCPYLGYMPIFTSNLPTQYLPMQKFNQYIPYLTQPIARNPILLKDYGPEPFAINIEEATEQNNTFRTALWTGKHLQLTLMSINVGDDIGLEMHPDVDQFIRIEEGQGIVKMGDRKDKLDFQANVRDDFIFIIPAGKWHNLFNTGNRPIKLYSIYAPPQHPHGTVHKTKADAQEAEEKHRLR